MYPRNSASPPRISVGAVVQISDGAVQTAGVSIVVRPEGGAETAGAGTLSYGATSGIVYYTPTQAETDYVAFVVVAYKTGCIPAEKAVITSARSTSGEVQVGGYASGQVPLQPTVAGRTLDVSAGGEAGIDLANVGSPTTTLNLTGTTIKTASDNASQTSVDTLTTYVDTEVAAIKAKTDNLPAQPAAVSDIPTANQNRDAVMNADPNGGWADGSFGDRWLISANNTRNLAITGSGHIAAVLHDAEPNSIPEDAFVTGSISARAIGTDAIDADALADGAITAGVFAADSITATALATSAGEEIADKVWDEAIAAHLASGSTGEALNNAGGSGNPWITDLSTGYTGTQAGNILNQVKAKTDLITTGTIQSSIPVTAQGQITGPLFIGDDYLQANGRAFQWTVALPSGFVAGTSTCRFGMEHAEGATEGASFAVAGTVTNAGGGNVTLSFDVPKATTGTLKAGFYRWSVEIASAGGNEVTRVASDGKKLVEWREKQT